MKTLLLVVNSIFLIVTIITVIISDPFSSGLDGLGGLIAQFFLGVFQLVVALCFFIKWKKYHRYVRKNLTIYWILVILYGIGSFLYFYRLINISSDLEMIAIHLIPLCMATYLVFVTYLYNKYRAETVFLNN